MYMSEGTCTWMCTHSRTCTFIHVLHSHQSMYLNVLINKNLLFQMDECCILSLKIWRLEIVYIFPCIWKMKWNARIHRHPPIDRQPSTELQEISIEQLNDWTKWILNNHVDENEHWIITLMRIIIKDIWTKMCYS